jgi:hypothetical protein
MTPSSSKEWSLHQSQYGSDDLPGRSLRTLSTDLEVIVRAMQDSVEQEAHVAVHDEHVVAQYAGFAASIQRDHIYRAVIQYPLVHGAIGDPRGSILVPRLNLIQDLAARAFPVAGTLPVGMDTIPEESTDTTKTKLPSVTCSAPAPPPTTEPTPTDKPGGGPPTPAPTAPPPDPTAAPAP